MFGIAKNVPGIKAWSADGWQLLTIDFMGNTTPVKWTNAIVRLKLPPTANAQEYCYEGWEAMVKVNFETKVVEETDYPSKTNNQCGGLPLSGTVQFSGSAIGTTTPTSNSIIPEASAALTQPGRAIAEQRDVIGNLNSYYGNLAYLKTPTVSTTIYSKMDA